MLSLAVSATYYYDASSCHSNSVSVAEYHLYWRLVNRIGFCSNCDQNKLDHLFISWIFRLIAADRGAR